MRLNSLISTIIVRSKKNFIGPVEKFEINLAYK